MESSKSSRSSSPADERHLINDWQPEPLVPDLSEEQLKSIQQPHVITSKPGKMIEVDGKWCLNVGTHNYLNLADSPRLEKASLDAIKKYGVGSCGPRAFYGTMDVHLELEEAIAKFLNVQEAVLYSYGFSTIASAIPAYAKASDTILFDERCNFAIQKGITASRSRAIKFKHNDVNDLRTIVRGLVEEHRKRAGKKEELRLFLIIEGIYANTGTMCPLRELVEVAKEFKMRLFMDESRSFGVLGAEGKGLTQHLKVDVEEIDLIMVSLETSLSSFGGFCAGTAFIIDHQRLAGSGYCFSASLPPFQCSAALEALRIIQEEPSLVSRAQEMFAYADEKFQSLSKLRNISHKLSPIKILVVRKEEEYPEFCKQDEEALAKVCDDILRHDLIAMSASKYLRDEEASSQPASIKIVINADLTSIEIDRIFTALSRAAAIHIT